MLNSIKFVRTTDEVWSNKTEEQKDLYKDSIVFIEDTKLICSNGIYYGSSNSQNIIDITYSELKTLRDNSQLIPGMLYRITDYVATTTQEETMSANHPFDIIVLALDNKTLSEEASAIQHEGDTYFANSNLNAWKLWYSLDNDKSRFVWADEENGKGVIYRMIDEFNNDVAYDFKGILFVRTTEWFSDNDAWLEGIFENFPQEDKWFYTFSWINENEECEDLSIIGNTLYNDEGYISGVFGNKILEFSNYNLYGGIENSLFALSKNIFVSSYLYESDTFYGCNSNTLSNDCYSNTLGNCCNSNTLGNCCHSNTFGSNCNSNMFGYNCYSNTFGYNCNSNMFGDYCIYNTFSDYCNSNMFGNNCHFIHMSGGYFNSNTFGNDCRLIELITKSTGKYQLYKFASGLQGSSLDDMLEITLITPNLEYETKVAKRTNGEIVVYNEADLVPWTYISE